MIVKNSYSHGATQIPIPQQDFMVIEIEGELTPYQKIGNFYTFKNPNKSIVNVWSYDGEKEGREVRSIISMQKKLVDVNNQLASKKKKLSELHSDIKSFVADKIKLEQNTELLRDNFAKLDIKRKESLDMFENTTNILEESLMKHRKLFTKDVEEYEKKHAYIVERYEDIERKLSLLDANIKQKLYTFQKQSELIENRYNVLESAIKEAVSRADLRLADSEKRVTEVTRMSLESINNSFTQHREALGKPLKEITLIDQRTNKRMKLCMIDGNLSIEEM
jgi:hypothetical protein